MAGQFRFKNNSGTVVAQISASNAGAMSFSGSALDFSSVTTLTLGTSTLTGTASFATTAVSSSYGLNALTGSNAMTASSADTLYVRNNATVLGSITAQTLIVQTITSSVLFTTGSNKIGSSLSNVQELTGSVGITGSLSVNTNGLFVSSSGNVGIGTILPSDFIDATSGAAIIAGSGRSGLSLGSTQGTADEVLGRLSFTNTNSTNAGGKRLAYISGIRGTTNNSAYLEFGTANDGLGAQRMVITQAGNVGIGNTGNASRKLEVNHPTGYSAGIRIIAETGPGDAKIQFFGGGSSQMDIGPTAASPNDLIFGAGGSERMRILSSGLFKLTQETNTRYGVQIKKFTVAASSSTTVTFDPADFGLVGGTGQYHLEIDAGAYGGNFSGPGVYKLVFGGYSTTPYNNATAVLANTMTTGSWGWSMSGSVHTITITNTNGTYQKEGIIRFTVTYTGA